MADYKTMVVIKPIRSRRVPLKRRRAFSCSVEKSVEKARKNKICQACQPAGRKSQKKLGKIRRVKFAKPG
jgi:hypothetical protein